MRLVLCIALLVAACDDPLLPDPVASLSVETLEVDNCGTLDGWDITLNTDGVDPCGETLFVRLQAGGRPINESDGILVEIDVEVLDALREVIAADDEVELPLPDLGIRCSLYLHKRCSDSYQPLVCGAGLFRAERLDTGTRLRFDLEVDVQDLRTGEVVGAGLVLAADFPVSTGSPLIPFSGCPED